MCLRIEDNNHKRAKSTQKKTDLQREKDAPKKDTSSLQRENISVKQTKENEDKEDPPPKYLSLTQRPRSTKQNRNRKQKVFDP